jgi:hypothetical protein
MVVDRAVGGGGSLAGKSGGTVLWAVAFEVDVEVVGAAFDAVVVGDAFADVVVEVGFVYDEVVVFGAAVVEVAVRKLVVDANADTVGEEAKLR